MKDKRIRSRQNQSLLTPYDEYPVHQTPYPFSQIPVTDYGWDEGYYFGVFNADAGVFLLTGMRVNPNADTIGAHAGLNMCGVQRTARLSRTWRQHCYTQVGPLRYDFVEPFRNVRLRLDENESGLSFDLNWLGLAPAHLSSHALAVSRGRRTTDQSRYNQVGAAEGWIRCGQREYAVNAEQWKACRDHSWGIYESRPPFSVESKWLPPADSVGPRRALRLSVFLATETLSGHFHLHEDEDGNQIDMNDAFGIAFEGALDRGWEQPRLHLVSASHELVFRPETRSVTQGTLVLVDENGDEWRLTFDVPHPPHVIIQVGYHQGSWRDGGTIHTWHGPAEPYIEWDEFDFSQQPAQHVLYGQNEPRTVYGAEHVALVELAGPDGFLEKGQAQIELFLNGRYGPYGFEAQVDHGKLTGRGIA